MIVIDTREKKWEHIKEYLDRNNIEYEVKKLDVGDYYNTENPDVVVDRKANLQEVCTNLQQGKENSTRFYKECRRAFDKKLRLIVLIEETNCKTVADVKQWTSKYSKHTGQWLYKEMFRLFMAYKVEWVFCKKNETPQRILELLEYDNGRD